MSVIGRSRTEELRKEVVAASNEAATLIEQGDCGPRARACLDRADRAVARLKLLYDRIGMGDGRDDAVELRAVVEKLQAKLSATNAPSRLQSAKVARRGNR